jgi:hypothetical protein
MNAVPRHRLEGLEPDNLLAFLALLGLLRALETADRLRAEDKKFRPRVAWDVDNPPLRPVLHLAHAAIEEQVAEAAAEGLASLSEDYTFDGQEDLDYHSKDARVLLEKAAKSAVASKRNRVELLAALMTDAAVKEQKGEEAIDPTPLCLLFGQGHQHFLDRLSSVPKTEALPPGRGKKAVSPSAAACLLEALFRPWRREDSTFSFRWDPDEDVRYALMAGDPTDAAYKSGTQHGANQLAAIGLAALTVVPEIRAGRVRPSVPGGAFSREGFSLAWPIWREPATLSAIRSLLGHPKLRESNALEHLGIDHVVAAKRISVGKFMNFTRARPVESA